MENEQNIIDAEEIQIEKASEPQLVVTTEIKGYLKIASTWGTFLSIMGFITTGLLGVVGILVMVGFIVSLITGGFNNPEFSQFGSTGMLFFMGLMYLGISVFYYFPSNYLYQFSKRIKLAITNDNMDELTLSFKNLKSCFKFVGIGVIVMLSLYVVAIIAIIGVAAYTSFSAMS